MTQAQLDFWNTILSTIGTLIVVVGAITGVIKYFQEQKQNRKLREEELAWRKTQFVLDLAEKFEKDEQYQIVSNLFSYGTGVPKGSSLQKILRSNVKKLNRFELGLRKSIDHYLDFFDRLYHFSLVTHALDVADLEVFGWYIAQIDTIKDVHDYAESSGFEDVITLNEELGKRFEKKHWFKTVHIHGN